MMVLVEEYLYLVVLIAHLAALLLHLRMRVSRIHYLFDILYRLLTAALPLKLVCGPGLRASNRHLLTRVLAHEVLLVLVADILYICCLELGVIHAQLHAADAVFAALLFQFIVLVYALGCKALLSEYLLALVVEMERALVLVVDDVYLVSDYLDGLLLVLLPLHQLLLLVILGHLLLLLRLLLADLPPQRRLLLIRCLCVDDDAVVADFLQILDA